MKSLIETCSEDIQYLNDILANLSHSGDADFIEFYERKLKLAESSLIEELAKEADQDGDTTLILYRTKYFGIVTPQIARRIFNKEIL